MSEPYKLLDLFSGIGGFSLGLEKSGLCRTVGFCEIDAFCRKILAKHWPKIPTYDNVITRQFVRGEADVISAGFPCQDISYAGAGAGLAGERSGLYREVVRAIRLVRPAYAILENVAALLGRGLDVVLGDMAEIGYDAEWHCIPASAVGAPHRRDRIWIVANPGSEQHEGYRAPLSGPLSEKLYGSPPDAYEFHDDNSGHGSGKICRERKEQTSLSRSDASYATGEDDWTSYAREGERQVSEPGNGSFSPNVANAPGEHVNGSRCGTEIARWSKPANGGWWSVEPNVDRVAHGISSRVDRLRSLGNAVVPQIPQIIGEAILASEASR